MGTFLFIFSSVMEESLKPLLSTSCSSLVRLNPPIFVVVVVGVWDGWWDFCGFLEVLIIDILANGSGWLKNSS